MGARASRPHNPTKRQFLAVADRIAQEMGYKDHADAIRKIKEAGRQQIKKGG
ncbi:hypothetical protein LCGC14_0349940 [marine sediment metagenome]|uniref:Uncharacterized protein n=1 Tax=marine sediment metagenome TaxID=412755 RepID=A0A0F9TU27_9ZZZZ